MGKHITESTKKTNPLSRLCVKGICAEMCLLISGMRKQAPSTHIHMCCQCCAVFFNMHSGSCFTLKVVFAQRTHRFLQGTHT